jgi:hypothetical protein
LLEWRAVDAAYRRLIDVELCRRAERVIILDSDVLTNAHPQEIADWARRGRKSFLLGQAPTLQAPPVAPSSSEHVQSTFLRKVPDLSRLLGNEPIFLQGTTAGFCGYSHEISLARVEAVLKAALALGLPMAQWGGDQCLVIYLLSVSGAERLDGRKYINFDPAVRAAAQTASIIHFFGTHRFYRLVYPRLAAAAVRRFSSASANRKPQMSEL